MLPAYRPCSLGPLTHTPWFTLTSGPVIPQHSLSSAHHLPTFSTWLSFPTLQNPFPILFANHNRGRYHLLNIFHCSPLICLTTFQDRFIIPILQKREFMEVNYIVIANLIVPYFHIAQALFKVRSLKQKISTLNQWGAGHGSFLFVLQIEIWDSERWNDLSNVIILVNGNVRNYGQTLRPSTPTHCIPEDPFIHSLKYTGCLLNAYYVPSTVLGLGIQEWTKEQKPLRSLPS